MRTEVLENLRTFYLSERQKEIDPDFLEFEENRADLDELTLLANALGKQVKKAYPNPNNSILLYLTGLTHEFNRVEARSKMVGGSPPDIDIDMSAATRPVLVEWLKEEWGEECVSQIGTFGTFKPKSITHRYFKMTEDTSGAYGEVTKMIPEPLFGREATLEEVVKGDESKGYSPHPQILTNSRYSGWYEFASKVENMIANQGVHAAGLVLSSFPISDVVPTWKNGTYDRITQWDMKEVEELGLIKFDLLVINNGDIIAEARKLINERHGIDIDVDNIPDGDGKTYDLMGRGLLSGDFQFETSKTIKEATLKAQPRNYEELADISSLIRPGPYGAGFLDRYLDRDPDLQLPEPLRELWSGTRGVLVYQEQLMAMFVEFCGYSPEESDNIRRIVGKKKPEALKKLEPDFLSRFQSVGGFSLEEATYVWDVVLGCADYLFNKSHAVAYSYVTYVCAYLKANYPLEFFCALMTVRSQVMQPKVWASKASEYVLEAQELGVQVMPPSVNHSEQGFTIKNDKIYFGLNGIRGVGAAAANAIYKSRKSGYRSLGDFVNRSTSKVTTATAQSLAKAGAFDCFGVQRPDACEAIPLMYDYKRKLLDYHERVATNEQRQRENIELQKIIDRRNELKRIARLKSERDLDPEENYWLEENKKVRLHRTLKVEEPEPIEVPTSDRIRLDVRHMIEQAEYIGCFLGRHPVRILFPQAIRVNETYIGSRSPIAGQISSRKNVFTRNGRKPMCFLQLTDGTGTLEICVFPRQFAWLKEAGKLPEAGDLVMVKGKIESEDPQPKMILNDLTLYRNN